MYRVLAFRFYQAGDTSAFLGRLRDLLPDARMISSAPARSASSARGDELVRQGRVVEVRISTGRLRPLDASEKERIGSLYAEFAAPTMKIEGVVLP